MGFSIWYPEMSGKALRRSRWLLPGYLLDRCINGPWWLTLEKLRPMVNPYEGHDSILCDGFGCSVLCFCRWATTTP